VATDPDSTDLDPWAATVAALAKLEGRSTMGPGRLMPGASHAGKAKRGTDSGLREAHLPGQVGSLLDRS
jgi:hypothetical protein